MDRQRGISSVARRLLARRGDKPDEAVTYPAIEKDEQERARAGALFPLTEQGLATLYANLRAYSEHEDSLIGQRLTWLLSIQAFLLATYSFTMQKVADNAYKAGAPHAGTLATMDFALLAFGAVLIVISLRFTAKVDRAINAAHAALSGLRKIWYAYQKAYHAQTGYEFIPFDEKETNDRWFAPMFGTLPFVHGGGHRNVAKHTAYEAWRDETLKIKGKLSLFDRDARYQGYSASADIPSIFFYGWAATAVIHAIVCAVMVLYPSGGIEPAPPRARPIVAAV